MLLQIVSPVNMKTILPQFLILIIAIGFIQANPLPFTTKANHLAEVNPEWEKQELLTEIRHSEYLFVPNDTERIKFHLLEVIDMIRKNTSQNDVKAGIRNSLMNQLEEYARVGLFPENTSIAHRNPIFIDNRGVHCAVGYLMMMNGFSDLAQSVRNWNNPVYLRDIPVEWLSEWMYFSGLTIDEMALIQPGYPPTQQWTNHGVGFTGQVTAIREFNGQMYITGDLWFGEDQRFLARYEDNHFVPLPTPPGVGKDLAVFENRLYVAGEFGMNNLAVWNSSDEMEMETIGMSKYPLGYCFHVASGLLYFSVDASGFAPMSAIYQFDGQEWSNIALGLNPTYAMTDFEGKLIAAGEPGNIYGPNQSLLNVAVYDGSGWTQLGEGVNEPIYALMPYGEELFICGPLKTGDEIQYGFGKWTGSEWVMTPVEAWNNYFGFSISTLEDMAFRGFGKADNHYFIFGDIVSPWSTMVLGSGLFRFYPEAFNEFPYPWQLGPAVLPNYASGRSVLCMAFDGQRVWAGGDFETGPFYSLARVASSESFIIGVPEIPRQTSVTAFPNPTSGTFRVMAASGEFREYSVVDARGRKVAEGRLQVSDTNPEIIISHLSTGVYQILLTGPARSTSAVVILQE
jgi:hypothetical protein